MRFFVGWFVVLFLVWMGKAQDQKVLDDLAEHHNQMLQEKAEEDAENAKVFDLWFSSIYKLRKNGYFIRNETLPRRLMGTDRYPGTTIIYPQYYYCEVLKPGDFTIKKNTLYTIRPFKTWKYDDVIRVAAEL